MSDSVIAVDVGTRQVRAGLFDPNGSMLLAASAPITLVQRSDVTATYRMDEIWDAVCSAVEHCARGASDLGARVVGLAFDATSSLHFDRPGTAIDDDGGDVFCWMDQRAQMEALEIDATDHPYLQAFSGSISPEFHLPKILWLAHNRPDRLDGVLQLRDLCDELARRATGVECRSRSALVCKWPYVPDREDPWCTDLLAALGLRDRIGPDLRTTPVRAPGAVHGRITPEAAVRLGVAEGVVVAVGVIDAEAGVLGNTCPNFRETMTHTLLMTGGTSTNFMLFSADKRPVPGVWGPFLDAVFPGWWMLEAGQSLSGGALDAVFRQHPASPGEPTAENHERAVRDVTQLLRSEPAFGAQRHVVPDWLGNRAPLNNSRVRAIMSGLGPDLDYRSFLETYYAAARGLALQTRQVIEHFGRHGNPRDVVHLSGGHRHNPLLVQLYADCIDGELLVSNAPEPVLLGTAMIAAVAAGCRASLFDAVDHMASRWSPVAKDRRRAARLDSDYAIYEMLVDTQKRIFAAATQG